MAICTALCKNGNPCKNKAKTGQETCAKHPVVPPIQHACGHTMTNGSLCKRERADGHDLCAYHVRIDRERRQRLAMWIVWNLVLDLLWTHRDEEGARTTLANAFNSGEISEQGFVLHAAILEEEAAFMAGIRAPVVVAKSELHALALDGQNVHTGPVKKQTDEGLELLLSTPIPEGQDTLAEVAKSWSHRDTIKSVLRDMRMWAKTSMCRDKDDFLYKRALDGLWARIKISPAKDELIERLWQECSESLGVCCGGHLSRLCNVMTGFDDAFKPPVSIGELLQQRMAAIAAKDIHPHLKVEEAWAVFEELGVPRDQRQAWIEAF